MGGGFARVVWVDVVDGRSRSECPARNFRTDLREAFVGVCHKRDSELEG
jgi:hypothetical protein